MSTRKKDEGFTNIRIREETREELRAIGRYGENMDDIVRKCLAAYKAITSSGGKVVNKIVVEEPIKEQPQTQQQYQQPQPQQSQPRQQTNQQSQIQLQKFYEDNAPVIEPDGVQWYDGYFTMLWLPGVKFPIHTNDLIKFHWENIHRSFDKGHISKFKEKFSNRNRTYWRKDELEEDLKMIFDTDMENKGKPGRMIDCILISDEDKIIADEHFMEEYVRRARESGLLAPQDVIDKLPYIGGVGVDFPITLPEIKYPINKKRLIQLATEFQKEFRQKYNKIPLWMEQTLFIMENLPDSNRPYKSLGRFMDDLKLVVHNRNLKNIKYMKNLLIEKKLLSTKSHNVQLGILSTEEAKNNWMQKIVEKDDILRQLYKEQQEREQQGKTKTVT